MYSNMSGTESPVLAEEKKSLGPTSGGGEEVNGGLSGGISVGSSFGFGRVIVSVDDVGVLDREGRGGIVSRVGDDPSVCAEGAGGGGDGGGDSSPSKREDEGVWYTEMVVLMVVIVPTIRDRLVSREGCMSLWRWLEGAMSIEDERARCGRSTPSSESSGLAGRAVLAPSL